VVGVELGVYISAGGVCGVDARGDGGDVVGELFGALGVDVHVVGHGWSEYVSRSWWSECLVLRRQDTEVLRLNSVSPVGVAWRAMDGRWLMADGCCALEVAVMGRSLAMVVLGLGKQQ
jgi:hypothetical protein